MGVKIKAAGESKLNDSPAQGLNKGFLLVTLHVTLYFIISDMSVI